MATIHEILPDAETRADLAAAVGRYHASLNEGYLISRGIPVEVGEKWKLGTVVDPLPGHEIYRDRLVIPYWTPSGYSTLLFRCTQSFWDQGHVCKDLSHHPKYLGLGGYRPLFNVRALSGEHPVVYISEGEINAMVSTFAGAPCVATGGGSRWEPWWSYCFDGVERVLLLVDGDEAGRNWAKRVREGLPKAKPVFFPADTDVLDLYASGELTDFLGL